MSTWHTLMTHQTKKYCSEQEMYLNTGTIYMIIRVTLSMESRSVKWLRKMSLRNSLKDKLTKTGGERSLIDLTTKKLSCPWLIFNYSKEWDRVNSLIKRLILTTKNGTLKPVTKTSRLLSVLSNLLKADLFKVSGSVLLFLRLDKLSKKDGWKLLNKRKRKKKERKRKLRSAGISGKMTLS